MWLLRHALITHPTSKYASEAKVVIWTLVTFNCSLIKSLLYLLSIDQIKDFPLKLWFISLFLIRSHSNEQWIICLDTFAYAFWCWSTICVIFLGFENFQPQVTLWPRKVQGWLNECLKTNVLTSPNGQSVTKLFFKQPLIRSTRSCDRLIFCFKCIHRLRRSQFRCTVSITIILCGASKECRIVQKFCTIQR